MNFKKSFYYILFISIFPLLLLGIIIGSQRSVSFSEIEDSVSYESYLISENPEYDFGKISMKDGIVSHIFEIENSLDREVKIGKIFTSCMCTDAYLIIKDEKKGPFGMLGHRGYYLSDGRVLKPHEKAELEVRFDPSAHGPAGLGSVERFVVVEHDHNKRLVLKIKAQVMP